MDKRHLALTMVVFTFLLNGCMLFSSVYVSPDVVMPSNATQPSAQRTVDVSLSFVTVIGENDVLAQKFGAHARSVVQESGFFSQVVEGGDAKLNITVTNILNDGDLGGAIMAGVVSGCTFSLIGNVTDNRYRVDVSYTPAEGQTVADSSFNWNLAVTNGLLYSTPEGDEVDSIDAGIERLIEAAVHQSLAKFVK